jgi:4-hydroxy-2-oxoheptanedioate aldolase
MTDQGPIPGTERLNGAIRQIVSGGAAFASFCAMEPASAQRVAHGPADVAVFDLEHGPFDPAGMRHAMQYLLDRRLIAERGDLSPTVTPFVRIAANGAEQSHWMVKQALDAGAYGVIYPHIATAEQARRAVAAARYPRSGDTAGAPRGVRGFGPSNAARYWGLAAAAYFERAEAWPLARTAELLVVVMCETVDAVRALPEILEVAGIGAVLVGLADLALDLGTLDVTEPEVEDELATVAHYCRRAGVLFGVTGVGPETVATRLEQGFRLIVLEPTTAAETAHRGREWLELSGGRVQPRQPLMQL